MQNPPTNPAFSFDVAEADFETAVLERSLDVPVLLDCWAPWCGPCRSLGPVLEKLAQAYGGRFLLAKLNTDEAPQISAALQLRSIPQVMLFIGGQPVDQFSGALPEGQVRQFLDRHLPAAVADVSTVQQLREQAAAADPETAEALLRDALGLEPDNAELAIDLAERLVARGALDEAQTRLDALDADNNDPRASALVKRIYLARHRPAGDPQALVARIKSNPKDFEARFALAALHVHDGHFQAAFDELLAVVMRDKAEWREKARLQLVEWFEICPDAAVVSQGRRYLGMYLN